MTWTPYNNRIELLSKCPMAQCIEDGIFEKPKVLMILDSYLENWKGTERFFYEFGSYLQKTGYEVVLLQNIRRKTNSPFSPSNLQIKFNVITSNFNLLFGATKSSRQLIAKLAPDIIYVNSLNALPFIPLFNKKTIMGMHIIHNATKYQRRVNKLTFSFKCVMLKILANLIWPHDKILFHALTKSQYDWIEAVTNKKYEAVIVGNPISCPVEIQSYEYSTSRKNSKFQILYFGSWSENKGLLDFIKVIEAIEKTNLRYFISIVIAGGGELAKEVNSLAKQYPNIKIISNPSDKIKMEIMKKSDLFFYLSRVDAYPFTLCEAQIVGIPTIASDLAPFKDLIKDGITGNLVSLENSETKIKALILKYYEMWDSNYHTYLEMKNAIKHSSRRLCSEKVLPQLEKMVADYLKRQTN